jgi:inner membrane protein
MIGRTHDLAALTALNIAFIAYPPSSISLSTIIVAVIANLIGGITPDIDQPTAPLWRNLPIGKYFGKLFDKLLGGHRFLTHSIIGLILFGLAAHFLLVFLHPILGTVDGSIVWLAFMIGMVSHLVMDTFTKEGVPWLLPLPYKIGIPPVRALRITSGKGIENFVIFPALIIFNCWFYFVHYQLILDLLHHAVV